MFILEHLIHAILRAHFRILQAFNEAFLCDLQTWSVALSDKCELLALENDRIRFIQMLL